VQSLVRTLDERLRLLPGVMAVTATTNLPAGDFLGQFNTSMRTSHDEDFSDQYRGISPDYFGLFGIPLLAGREFTEGDRRGGVAVGIVTRAFARKYLGDHAVGQVVSGQGWSVRIVGVVGDTRQMGPQDEANAILYVPMAQLPDDMLAVFRTFEPLRMAVQVHGSPDSYESAVRSVFADVAPGQPIANLRSMAWIVHETTSDIRSNLVIIGVFALLALVLAAAGLYAVMAVAVAARKREFGVRLALGAPRHRLIGLVLRGGLAQVGIGLVCGAALAFACSGVARAVLVDLGRSALDPLALIAVCVLLAIVGLLACLPSAWQASRVPPMHALRGE
jgi:putative ABC transport system permease protein